ncbi:MAG TPA: hypothetical protein VJ124_00140 [Pyrinomonadaceae bacterium]|nr:hypothetical protein [Pyrinomonadaceae bacterium]
MVDLSLATRSLPRPLTLAVLFALLGLATGCNSLFGTHKKVTVPQLLTPLENANKPQLINEINRLATVQSLHAKIDIQFEDNSFAEAGIAEKYRQADGTITLQRPGKIYLIIQVPFIAKDIAQMTSDGTTFRVAVLQGDEKYRRFLKGTNSAVYDKLELNGMSEQDKDDKRKMSEKETVNALSNLRPQHLTDALLISQAGNEAGVFYSQSEFFLEEADSRQQAKKSSRIVRGYYLLEEHSQLNPGEAKLRRRFWFDRVGGIRLARLQSFNERGLLITDVSYADEKPFGEAGKSKLPARIEITRPQDQYKLNITYQAPSSVELDKDYRPEAFVLENRWQLPEVDLDNRQTRK